MGILDRVKAAAGRLTGRGTSERNVGGRAAGNTPRGQGPREPQGGPEGAGTVGGDNERNVGG